MTSRCFIHGLFSVCSWLLIGSASLAQERTVPLNSERIKAKFGSYGITVLKHEPVRVSKLFSLHDGQEVCRTLALVEFAEPAPAPLKVVLERVRAGASLGATLKASGWSVAKQFQYSGAITAGPRFLALAHLEQSQELAVAIYSLFAIRGEARHLIATVVEIHHPDYLTAADLPTIDHERLTLDPDIRRLLRLANREMGSPLPQ